MLEIIQVKSHDAEGSNSNLNLSEILKLSFFGRLYQRFIKPKPFLKRVVIYIWTFIFPLVFYIYWKYKLVGESKISKNTYPLKKISEYTCNKHIIYKKQKLHIPRPIITPQRKRGLSYQPCIAEFPDIFISTIDNCTITGKSNFMQANNTVICHDFFRVSHDYTSEELHGRFTINDKKSTVTIYSNTKPTLTIDKGVTFTDAVSGNYAHFLTEVLPKVYVYIKNFTGDLSDTSFIIDYGLHQNLLDALNLIIEERQIGHIFGLEANTPILVKSLKVLSPCGYVPFQRRPRMLNQKDHSDGMFSPHVFNEMANYIIAKIPNNIKKHNHKKIFIKRNSSYRALINSEEIESRLALEGFIVVEPERLSFIEQVLCFSNADVIIGPTGAALANIIFCKPDTKVIILTSDYKNMIFGYWQNIAFTVGIRVMYITGKCEKFFPNLHSNYKIKIEDLLDAIAH